MGEQAVNKNDIRRGDLLFLTAGHCDGLGRKVVELDGSPFSHVGLATGNGSMISARSHPGGFRLGDFGGVREDTLDSLWREYGREVHHAPVDLDGTAHDARERAVAQYLETPGSGASRSGFSVVKLVMVAATLDAWRPQFPEEARRETLEKAYACAGSWRVSERQPNFFCSEFVALAYGQAFERDALQPPTDESFEAASLLDWLAVLKRVRREVASTEQAERLGSFLLEVHRHDPSFIPDALRLLKEFLPHSPRLDGREQPALETSRLPDALVTPRMLTEASWVGPVRRVDDEGRLEPPAPCSDEELADGAVAVSPPPVG